MVTLGESHTVGASATQRQFAWPFVLKHLIDTFQAEPVELVNRGLGGDILSTACPHYRHLHGRCPIGLERYRRHLIDEQPDLAIISYGTGSARLRHIYGGATVTRRSCIDRHAASTFLWLMLSMGCSM